jgi:hypothetical protein
MPMASDLALDPALIAARGSISRLTHGKPNCCPGAS